MAGMKDKEFTMVVPGISRDEAKTMKTSFIKIKMKTAPNARGSIAIGKKDNFAGIMSNCLKKLNGGF